MNDEAGSISKAMHVKKSRWSIPCGW